MSWIRVILPEEAEGSLADEYAKIESSSGQVDQVLQVHSLRPHHLAGHMALYKSALHHSGNLLPRWFLEALGTFVSHLNGCQYCVEHHGEGLRRLLDDDASYYQMLDALVNGDWTDVFDQRQQSMLAYARALALMPDRMARVVIEDMHEAGVEDGEILEVNQVVGYFSYVNRLVLGLGVSHVGEELGLSPAGDDEDWQHR